VEAERSLDAAIAVTENEAPLSLAPVSPKREQGNRGFQPQSKVEMHEFSRASLVDFGAFSLLHSAT
jgi:hypothetical protein